LGKRQGEQAKKRKKSDHTQKTKKKRGTSWAVKTKKKDIPRNKREKDPSNALWEKGGPF